MKSKCSSLSFNKSVLELALSSVNSWALAFLPFWNWLAALLNMLMVTQRWFHHDTLSSEKNKTGTYLYWPLPPTPKMSRGLMILLQPNENRIVCLTSPMFLFFILCVWGVYFFFKPFLFFFFFKEKRQYDTMQQPLL